MAGGAAITLGPVLFHWPAERWRDFHFRIADEAPVDTVHLGEVVCAKRAPFLQPHLDAVAERLAAAGKEVVLSSPAIVMSRRDRDELRAVLSESGRLVEANDVAALPLLQDRPHAVGPFVNVYNEGTVAVLAARGAARVCLPVEMSARAIVALAARVGVELEVQAFGRLPLALSARCYHARAHGLAKDGCRYVCAEDPDGMDVTTLDGEPFVAINGVQVLSHGYASLTAEAGALMAGGVRRFRLWPHATDMVAVAAVWRDLFDGTLEPGAADERLSALLGGRAFINGYVHGRAGLAFVREAATRATI